MCFNNRIKDQIYNIIEENTGKDESIDLKETFEDIGIGSVTFIKIMVEIEMYYDIELDENYYINDNYANIESFINTLSECISKYKKN